MHGTRRGCLSPDLGGAGCVQYPVGVIVYRPQWPFARSVRGHCLCPDLGEASCARVQISVRLLVRSTRWDCCGFVCLFNRSCQDYDYASVIGFTGYHVSMVFFERVNSRGRAGKAPSVRTVGTPGPALQSRPGRRTCRATPYRACESPDYTQRG